MTHPKRAVKFGRKGREGRLGLGNPAAGISVGGNQLICEHHRQFITTSTGLAVAASSSNNLSFSRHHLTAAAHAIWAQYGAKFPSNAAELTVATATSSNSHQSHSPSSRCNNDNCSGNSKSRSNGSKNRGGRAQTPGWKDS